MRVKEHRAPRSPLLIVCICCSIVKNKQIFSIGCPYPACVVYTKRIIHISVGESGGKYPLLFTSTSVDNC